MPNIALLACLFLLVSCSRPDATGFLRAEAERISPPDEMGGVILAIGDEDGNVDMASSGLELDGGRIPPSGRVRVGSITKTFVAVVVLMLAEEDLIRLDAPATRYIAHPSLPSGVVVRDLLQHTSGIPNYTAQAGFPELLASDPSRSIPPSLALAFIRDLPPLFEPGTGWSYSNTNYIYLGLIVESVTGSDIDGVLEERIFDPLGLEDTYLAGSGRELPVIDTPLYEGDRGDPKLSPQVSTVTSAWTAGAMVSTARDLSAFFDALFDGELISRASLSEMLQPAPRSSRDDPPISYGLGLVEWTPTDRPALRLYGHNGGIRGSATVVFHDPTTGITYFLASSDLTLALEPPLLKMIEYTRTHWVSG